MKLFLGNRLVVQADEHDQVMLEFTALLKGSLGKSLHPPLALVDLRHWKIAVSLVECMFVVVYVQDEREAMCSRGAGYYQGECEVRGYEACHDVPRKHLIEPELGLELVEAFASGRSLRLGHGLYSVRSTEQPWVKDWIRHPVPAPEYKRSKGKCLQARINVSQTIVNEFAALLAEINEIQEDPDRSLDFDDAVQTARLIGGRVNRKRQRYQLKLMQDDGEWFAIDELGITDIEAIAEGNVRELCGEVWVREQPESE